MVAEIEQAPRPLSDPAGPGSRGGFCACSSLKSSIIEGQTWTTPPRELLCMRRILINHYCEN